MDKYSSETKSVTSQKNKVPKIKIGNRTCIHPKTFKLKLSDTQSPRNKQNMYKARNSLKLSNLENSIPIAIEESLESNPEYFLKSIETHMKTKINDMKLKHVASIRKHRKVTFQESNKQSNTLNNSTNNQIIKCVKEHKEITEDEKKLIIQRKFLRKYRKLRKAKIIYDSLEDDESTDEKENKYLIFAEGSNVLFVFDFIMLTYSIFLFFSLSINFANTNIIYIGKNKYSICFYYFADVLFISDTVIMFFRGFYDINHKFIKNQKRIIKQHLKKYFTFDILTGFPIFIIERYYYNQYYKNKELNFSDNYKIYETLRYMQFLLVLKVFKIFKVINKNVNYATDRFFEFITRFTLGEKIYLGLSYFIYSFAFLHLFACMHIFIGKQTYPNWIIYSNMEDSTFASLYITSIYFLIETMTTVGYGDITNVCTIYSLIFQIVLLSVGIAAYSWIITILGTYVKNETRAQIKYNQNLTLLEEIRLENPQLPFRLYNKIHQHFESLSHQQNKCDLNIFVSSLPYSLKNNILFNIYEKPVKNFKFFKGNNNENSDFILCVLTGFIPLFSKKNAVLMREGEIPENIVFVKNGKLSLEAAIDLRNPQKSAHKYLHLNFEDNFNEKTNNLESGIERLKTLNEKNILEKSYMHESFADDEIAKYDLGENDLDNAENVNLKFLNILNIYRNEHIGNYYLFNKKQFPLTLRVKSKTASIFLLRKNDALKISVTFPKIWEKIAYKSTQNFFSLKELTFKKINNYCISHNIILDPNKNDGQEKKKIKIDVLNALSIKEILQIEKVKNEERRSLKPRKSSKKNSGIIWKSSGNLKKKSFFSQNDENKKYWSSKSTLKRSSGNSPQLHSKSSKNIKIRRSNIIIDKCSGDTTQYSKFKSTSNKKYSTINEIKEYTSFKSKLRKTTKNHKNHKNKKYYKMLCIKFMRKLNNIQNSRSKKTTVNFNLAKEKNSIAENNTTNILNITNDTCLNSESENEINLSFSSSSSSCFSPCFNLSKLLISFQESLTFSSSYKNLNLLSNGKYIKDKNLREETQNFLKDIQESYISSSKFSNISPIKRKNSQNSNYLQEHKLLDNNHSSPESKSEEKQSKNSKIKKQNKNNLNRNYSVNLNHLSKINIEKVKEEKTYKKIESNVDEKSDVAVIKQINEDSINKGSTSNFPSILKSIMNENKSYHPDSQSDKSSSNDFFMEFRFNRNNNEYIKNESIKKMMLNNVERRTGNNLYKIKQYNTKKTENNKMCIIF